MHNAGRSYTADDTILLGQNRTLQAQWKSVLSNMMPQNDAYLIVTDLEGHAIGDQGITLDNAGNRSASILVASSKNWHMTTRQKNLVISPANGVKDKTTKVTLSLSAYPDTDDEYDCMIQTNELSAFGREPLSSAVTVHYDAKDRVVYMIRLKSGAEDAVWRDENTSHTWLIAAGLDVPVSTLASIARDGYSLGGWMDEDGVVHPLDEVLLPEKNMTLEAVWIHDLTEPQWLWPVKTRQKYINSPFTLHNFCWTMQRYESVKSKLDYGEHNGIDIKASSGASVFAARSGVVRKIGAKGGYICLEHPVYADGCQKTVYANYVHMDSNEWIYREDVIVARNQSTGEYVAVTEDELKALGRRRGLPAAL